MTPATNTPHAKDKQGGGCGYFAFFQIPPYSQGLTTFSARSRYYPVWRDFSKTPGIQCLRLTYYPSCGCTRGKASGNFAAQFDHLSTKA